MYIRRFLPRRKTEAIRPAFRTWNAARLLAGTWKTPSITRRELEEDDCMLPSQTAAEHIPLKEGEMVRMIMVRIKLLPDSE